MSKFATRYEILRDVSSTSRKPCSSQPSAKPLFVGFLLSEARLVETGGLIAHYDTVFLEDPGHDWDWRQGVFYYYGRAIGVEEVGDIVVVLEAEDRPGSVKKD